MYASVFSIFLFVFFVVSGSSRPSEVYLSFSFVSFSAAYFYPLLLSPPFQCLCSFLPVNRLFPLFLICLSASSRLADGTCSTFSRSALLSPPSDVSLYCGVSHDLSLRDPMPPDISPGDCLCSLSEIHATFPLFSLFLSVSFPLLAFSLP